MDLPNLRTAWLGRRHEHHVELDSTNDRASALAAEGASAGTLVTADRQRAGRGRRGRAWDSSDCGDIYASFLVRLPAGPAVSACGLVMGVAIREALAAHASQPVMLKWPNDVRIGQRKISGVLCESRWNGQEAAVVVGFGVNVGREAMPDGLSTLATSLARAARDPAHVPSRPELLTQILEVAEPAFDRFAREGFSAVRERYEAACETLHRRVYLQEGSAAPEGVFADSLADDGALMVRREGRPGLHRVDAGEVSLSLGPD